MVKEHSEDDLALRAAVVDMALQGKTKEAAGLAAIRDTIVEKEEKGGKGKGKKKG